MAPSRAASCMYTDSRVVSHPGTAQPGTCDAAAHAAADADATTPQQRSAPLERASLQRPASGQQDVVWRSVGRPSLPSARVRPGGLAEARDVPRSALRTVPGTAPAADALAGNSGRANSLPAVSHVHVCSHFDVPVHVICGRLLCITFVWHCTYGTAPGSNERSLDLASRLENMRSRGAGRWSAAHPATRPGFF